MEEQFRTATRQVAKAVEFVTAVLDLVRIAYALIHTMHTASWLAALVLRWS